MGELAGQAGQAAQQRVPWVLIAGGFHRQGGMDKANAALAGYLSARQTPVHLVAHYVEPELEQQPGVTVHLVAQPAHSFWLGEQWLERRGQAVARAVRRRWPETRVVVNGGNCLWPDINWVHYVHHAWTVNNAQAPRWFQVKDRLTRGAARRRERQAINAARLVLTNSDRTRRDVINYLQADPARVQTVYLGTDPDWGLATAAERVAARAWLGLHHERPLIVFVGALGHDERKGFDRLWAAWQRLCARPDWDAELVVAGGGQRVTYWQTQIAQAGLAGRVRLLGATDQVAKLLAAADLLVSPVRYEAYGLNVQEALCCGVPALVSGAAGVAERYPADCRELLLADPEDVAELQARLLCWRAQMAAWKARILPLAAQLRRYTWTEMARRMVALAERVNDEASQFITHR